MAPSTSKSINDEGSQQYPYPSNVDVASFVEIKLDGRQSNYSQWQKQMLCLIYNYNMIGFIDGRITKPQMTHGSKTRAGALAYETTHGAWKNSDTLVREWILGSLSEDVMRTVVGLETAYDTWNALKANYYTISTDEKEKGMILICDEKEKDVHGYAPLYRAIQMGDWETAAAFFIEDKRSLTDKVTIDGNRSLHVAVGTPDNIPFLEKLLKLFNPESLPSMINNNEQTPLHYCAVLDNTEAAKKLVEKNPELLFMVDDSNQLPIQKAVFRSHKSTLVYLLQVCKQHIGHSQKKGYYNPFVGEKGVSLLNDSILSGFLDVACDLLKDYPQLARTKVAAFKAPLWCIAKMRNAYPSGEQYNFYQRFVYSYVPTENHCLDHIYKNNDIENQRTCRGNLFNECAKSYVYPVIQKACVKLWMLAKRHVLHIKRLHEDKVKHKRALTILKFICEEVGKLKYNHFEHFGDAFTEAVRNNTPEVIEHITKIFPHSMWTIDANKFSLAQVSIMNRCEHVYNFFVHEVTHNKYLHTVRVDKDKNNLLHLAAKLAPEYKLNMVSGAALQMQRELQWFKEVSKFMRPREREAMNNKHETPIMVFRTQHKDLRQKGEEWLKKTADSYTITAALIITIVFAAAITVPGGNKGDTGTPTFQTRPSFIVFAVSDAVSLFTSTTSLLLFLSVLTARYADEDFLYKLPKRLILGLVMLFMSVTSMMIAFSATLYIMFGQEKSWILIPIAALTCLPIASYVTLQLPLLVDLISSTYARGIFGKRNYLRITL